MNGRTRKRAIIIGAGPAGLTAAYELVTRTDVQPVVLEKSEYMGGISRTVNYKGNRIDIGGHRFFSKSDRVMEWWLQILPLAGSRKTARAAIRVSPAGTLVPVHVSWTRPEAADQVMCWDGESRGSIILRRFFDYPIRLSMDYARKARDLANFKVRASYQRREGGICTTRHEQNPGTIFLSTDSASELYRTFFKSYTEKVWGVPCDRISAEWGAQRIKGLSVWSTLVTHRKKS